MYKYILSLILLLSSVAYTSNETLIEAAKNGDLKEVKALIKQGADTSLCAQSASIQTYINATSDFGEETALIQASRNNHIKIVKLLLKNNVVIDSG